jgi:predicted ester cyclase
MDIRELTDRAQDAWNAKDEDSFVALYAEDHEVVAPGFTGKGIQGVRDFWALWNGAFPDNRIAYRTLLVDGQQAAQLATFQGTHTGPLTAPDGSAIPPTGRPMTTTYTLFTTMDGDKVARSEFMFDQMEMLGQLGLLPG